jgi:hypothetical protein
MNTLSPALAHAISLLRNDLYLHLDETEALATGTADWQIKNVESARKLICDLAEMVRSVVAQYTEDELGDCRFCLNRRWPCSTIDAIHRVLRDPEREFVRLIPAEP